MTETGYMIKEEEVITRVAEGAITFEDGAQYAPVIEGTSTDQIKAATDSATTVVGFVKKPTEADSIADGDVCSVVVAGLIKVPTGGAVAINSPLQVYSTVTKVEALTYSAIADLAMCVGLAKSSVGAAGNIWMQVGRR